MIEELKLTADELHREGRLDKKISRRLKVFKFLSFIFGLITVYDILFEGFYWFHVFIVVSVSFLIGLMVLAKMHKVVWDKKKQIMVTQKMDIFGIFILVAYIGARVFSDAYLNEFFNGNVSKVLAYTFFIIFGVTLGRFVGTLISIYLAQPKSHRRLRFFRRKKGV
jgi:hypothetical protein